MSVITFSEYLRESPYLRVAYGGVVFDERGRVLLREPTNHYDGYVWTFPKGTPRTGESPEDAALREVLEETGYPARILSRIPGDFATTYSTTVFFLMRATGAPRPFDKETTSVQWVSMQDAETMIRQTTNPLGRARDLAVLAAAKQMAFPK